MSLRLRTLVRLSDCSKDASTESNPLKNHVQLKIALEMGSSNQLGDSKGFSSTQKLSLTDTGKSDLKLVLSDEPTLE